MCVRAFVLIFILFLFILQYRYLISSPSLVTTGRTLRAPVAAWWLRGSFCLTSYISRNCMCNVHDHATLGYVTWSRRKSKLPERAGSYDLFAGRGTTRVLDSFLGRQSPLLPHWMVEGARAVLPWREEETQKISQGERRDFFRKVGKKRHLGAKHAAPKRCHVPGSPKMAH